MVIDKQIHGLLNAISWGILFPVGAIIARYLRSLRFADPFWFYLHVICQFSSYVIGVTGWAIGLDLGAKSKGIEYTSHRIIGIVLFCIATLQVPLRILLFIQSLIHQLEVIVCYAK